MRASAGADRSKRSPPPKVMQKENEGRWRVMSTADVDVVVVVVVCGCRGLIVFLNTK